MVKNYSISPAVIARATVCAMETLSRRASSAVSNQMRAAVTAIYAHFGQEARTRQWATAWRFAAFAIWTTGSLGLAQTAGVNAGAASAQTANDRGGANPKSEATAILEWLEQRGSELDRRFTRTRGRGFVLSEKKPGPVVLYFWSSAERECLEDLTKMRALAKEYGKAQFYCINLDRRGRMSANGPDGKPLPGRQKWEPSGFASDVAQRLAVTRVPMVYVFDSQGGLCGVGDPRDLRVFLETAAR